MKQILYLHGFTASRLHGFTASRLRSNLALFFFCFPLFVQAQLAGVNNYVKSSIAPSPNAAALGKYGDIPISYFTGVPNITIPIGSVDEGSLSVPISLSYHAGGIKVAEMASWVGLGWTMQANGMITRVIQGVPDDNPTKYGYYHFGNLLDLSVESQFIDCGKGNRDPEPDIFSCSFGGYSGKFYFNKDKLPEFIEKKDWLVTPVFATGGFTFDGFVITVENGTRYHFGKVQGSITAPMIERSSTLSEQSFLITSWYLVRIESHDLKDFINFNYTPDCSENKQAIFSKRTFSRSFFGTVQCNAIDKMTPEAGATSYSTVIQTGQRLTSISNSSGTQTVYFDANTVREDVETASYCGNSSNRLDNIRLVSGTYSIQYKLGYDYIGSGTTADNKRLRLLNVKKQLNNVDEEVYSLGYENTLGGSATAYPSTLSKQIDHWGYYNGATANDALYCLAPATKVMDNDGTSLTYGSANRESSEAHIKHGILKRINYPTGGFSEFEFEANKHSAIEAVVSENQVFYTVAGYEYFNTTCQTTLTTADKCFPLDNTPILNNYDYRIFVYNTLYSGSQICSGSSTVTVLIFDTQNNVQVGSVTTTSSTGWVALSTIPNLMPNKTYRVKITGSNVTTCVFEIKKRTTNTQLVTRAIGGLRIKQITNYDGISTNNNVVKTYEYLKNNSTTESSGYLFALPKYGHFIMNGEESVKAFVWQSGSITPMANFQGYSIGYQRVTERTLGNVGKTVYEYKIQDDIDNPGANYSSSPENFPVTPKRLSLGSGQLDKSSQYDNNNVLKASITNTGSITYSGTYTAPFTKFYSTEELVPPSPPYDAGNPWPQTCPYVPNNYTHSDLARTYKVSKYNIPSGVYRLTSKIDMLDDVSTATTYKYAPVSSHQLPLGTITMNSDGKTIETFNKYVMDYTATEIANIPNNLLTTDLVANLKSRNIISTPIETKTTVTSGTGTAAVSTTIDGKRTRYSFFNASIDPMTPTSTVSTNPIYIYQTYDYEAPHDYSAYSESRWQLKETLDAYDKTVGEPQKYTQSGWTAYETYTYGANRMMTKRRFGTAPYLEVKYGFVPNTRLLDTFTDENGLIKRYSYDPLMRLSTVKDRVKSDAITDPQTTTTYNYHFKTGAGDYNYISTSTVVANATNSTPLSTKQFMDGLGRPFLTIKEQYAPNSEHQKNYITYDVVGRQNLVYQPFSNTTLGVDASIPSTVDVMQTTYEESPLSRPKRQIAEDGKFVETQYGTNSANEVQYFAVVSNGDGTNVVNASGPYSAGSLFKTIILNENWNNAGDVNLGRTEIFKDKLGRLVLTRKFVKDASNNYQQVNTYNVYDDFGSLIMVIPPGAYVATNLSPTPSLVFEYNYDSRNRLIRKKVPNAEWVYNFYDDRDLLTLTQDGNMRKPMYQGSLSKHLGTEYNNIGQVIRTGWVATLDPVNKAKSGFSITDPALKLTETQYYTNPSFPNQNRTWVKHHGAAVLKPDTVTTVRQFIWSYIERRPGYEYTGNPIWTGKQHLLSKTYLNGSTPMPDLPINDNDYGGVNWTVNGYDGLQKPTLTVNYLYSGPNTTHAQEVRQYSTFQYDNGQRLKQTKHMYALNGAAAAVPSFILSDNNYNAKDQITEKNTAFVNNKFLQSTDFIYNKRGWLSAINNIAPFSNDIPLLNCYTEGAANAQGQLLNVDGSPKASGNDNNPDLFGEVINYDVVDGTMPGSATPQYNGNISQILWQVAGKEAQAYAFQYDNLDRLTDATYSDFHSYNTSLNPYWTGPYTTDNKYREKVTYDLRGNIQTLLRYGVINDGMTSSGTVCRTYGIIDNLAYAYNDPTDKNKLSAVKDLGDLTRGFKSINSTVNTQTTHYTYDDNGNLKSDDQKGITNILYNHLNLPQSIFFANNNRIEFIYDATGAKLRKTTYVNGVMQQNDVRNYINGIEYKGLNYVLDRFPTTEGAVVLQSNGTTYQYEHTLKDHLGNARVTYSDANNDGVVGVNDIKQVNHFYPYGLNMEGNWNGSYPDVKNKYMFNGKEWNDDFGLGWNHHDWRFYDVALARFVTVDPEGESGDQESWTPYHFSFNNPIKNNDPDGRFPIETIWDIGNVIYDAGKAVYHAAKGEWSEAKSAAKDLGADGLAMMIPYVPAGATKLIKAADKVADGTKAVTKTVQSDARTVALKAVDDVKGAKKTPTMTSGVSDRKTGKTWSDHSGKPHPQLNPKLAQKAPNPSKEAWAPCNCAETKAVNKALNDGAKLKNLEVHTVRTKTGEYQPPCRNCQQTLKGVKFVKH